MNCFKILFLRRSFIKKFEKWPLQKMFRSIFYIWTRKKSQQWAEDHVKKNRGQLRHFFERDKRPDVTGLSVSYDCDYEVQS